jgi:hypothetical protein
VFATGRYIFTGGWDFHIFTSRWDFNIVHSKFMRTKGSELKQKKENHEIFQMTSEKLNNAHHLKIP